MDGLVKVGQGVLWVPTGTSHAQLASERVKWVNKLNKELNHRRVQNKAALPCVETQPLNCSVLLIIVFKCQ